MCSFFSRKRRVRGGSSVPVRATPQPEPTNIAALSAEAMARVPDPLVIDLTDALHRLLCGDIAPNGVDLNGRCPRFKLGSAHHDYYELRAEILLEKMSPMIGRGNVQWAVVTVINELDL